MNVLAHITGKEFENTSFMMALCRMKIEKLYLIEGKNNPHTDFACLEGKYAEIWDNLDTHAMKYKNKLEGNSIIPLDKALLTKFEPYMLIAIKMLERTDEKDIPLEQRMNIIFTHLAYWNTFLDRHRIDIFLTMNFPHSGYNYIIYALCKIRGIKTAFPIACQASSYSYISDDVTTHAPEVVGVYNTLLEKFSDTPIEDIPLSFEFQKVFETQTGNDESKTPYFMQNVVYPDLSSFGDFKKRMAFFWHIISAPRGIKGTCEEYSRNSKTDEYYKLWASHLSCIDMENEKYIYFPLHYQPEGTTMPLGDCYVWQTLAIEMLNAYLPSDVYIYVKENPKQTHISRTAEFVEKLAALPRVKLVASDVDTYRLLNNSIAVASITGTAIWEGLFKAKPAIMFGNFIYEHAPGVFRVVTNEDCAAAIDRILNHCPAPTHKELKIFVKAMEEVCVHGFFDREILIPNYGIKKAMDMSCDLMVACVKKYMGDSYIL